MLAVATRQAVFSHVAQDYQYFTGIALLNPNALPATAVLQVFDRTTRLSASATVRLEGGERIAKLLSELTPIKNQIGGFIRIVSDRDLMMFSLFGTNTLSVLSAIPAQPLAP